MDNVSIRAFVYQGIITLLVVCVLCTAMMWSQYEISWYTIDGGGGTSSGGLYVLTGTIGQLLKNQK